MPGHRKEVLWACINAILVLFFYLRCDVLLIQSNSAATSISGHGGTTDPPCETTNNATKTKPHMTLAIAIGSKAEYRDRRDMIRHSWMQWATNASSSSSVVVKFFSDQPSDDQSAAVQAELDTYSNDMILSPSTLGGYWSSMARTLFQMEWFLERYEIDYFLRVDDDGFLCLPSVVHELQYNHAPTSRFVWAKYFCRPNMILPDENFLLLSRDLVEFFVASCGGDDDGDDDMSHSILRINDHATFAAHFGMWQHFLHLHVLDDRARINAQQGYVAKYMQSGVGIQNFCHDHIWSHYVRKPQVFQQVFALANAHYQEDPNNHLPKGNIQDRMGQICANASSPALRGPGQSCSAVTTSLYTQTGRMPGFQGSKGFPNIVSNKDYSCASP